MRVLGLDIGERRIGVALSDALGLTAQGLGMIERQSGRRDVTAIQELATQHAVEAIIVGLPLTLRGDQGPQAKRVAAFTDSLRRQVTVPIYLIDERLTTVQGERALLEMGASRRKRKQVIDQVAAQLILQQYLDTQRKS